MLERTANVIVAALVGFLFLSLLFSLPNTRARTNKHTCALTHYVLLEDATCTSRYFRLVQPVQDRSTNYYGCASELDLH